jgi:hypothetical protein
MNTPKNDEPTAVIAGDDLQGEFQRRLLACWQGIDAMVIELAERYDLMVIISALAEHTGTGLQALAQRETGGALQAQRLIGRIESNAFGDGNVEQHHDE